MSGQKTSVLAFLLFAVLSIVAIGAIVPGAVAYEETGGETIQALPGDLLRVEMTVEDSSADVLTYYYSIVDRTTGLVSYSMSSEYNYAYMESPMEPGEYVVKIEVHDDDGGEANAQVYLTVLECPFHLINDEIICAEGDSVTLDMEWLLPADDAFSISWGDGEITDYSWTGGSPSHTYMDDLDGEIVVTHTESGLSRVCHITVLNQAPRVIQYEVIRVYEGDTQGGDVVIDQSEETISVASVDVEYPLARYTATNSEASSNGGRDNDENTNLWFVDPVLIVIIILIAAALGAVAVVSWKLFL